MAEEKPDEKDQPKEKAVYEKSTAQKAAEALAAARENGADGGVVEYRMGQNPAYGVEENGGYIGTDPIYQNAADERQEPLTSDEDWQRALLVPPTEGAGEPTKPFVEYVDTETAEQPVDEPTPSKATPAKATSAKATTPPAATNK